jgi:hypothetical protein
LLQSKFKENVIILFAITVLVAVSFYDVVFFGKTFKVSTEVAQALETGVYGQEKNIPPFFQTFGVDSAVYEEPLYEFVKQSLWQGQIPLWNPHQALGYPMVAMLQTGMFFPLTFILYVFPQTWAWDVLILSRFFLAAFFTYLFMRRLKFKSIEAACAGIVFMLSGPLLLIQNVTANADILIPLLLFSLESLIQKPDNRRTVLTAVVVALLVFAGQPEHAFLNNAFGLAFLIFRTLTLKKRVHAWRIFFHLLIAYALALGLSGIVLLPFLANFYTQFWHGHPVGMGLIVEEIKARWITIIMPHFFQQAAMDRNWTPLGWLGGYIGVIPLGLAFVSLFNSQKKGLNFFFVSVAVLILGNSYGWPVINWVGYLPVLKMLRYAYHTPPLVAFSLAVAAAMGLRAVRYGKRNFVKGGLYVLIITGVIFFSLIKYHRAEFFPLAQQSAVFAFALCAVYLLILLARDYKFFSRVMIGALFLIIVWLELFSYISRVKSDRFDTFPSVPYVEYLKEDQVNKGLARAYGQFWTFFPNTASAYGVDDLGIFDGLLMRRFVDFVNHLLRVDNFVPDLRPTTLRAVPLVNVKEFLDLLNVRYLIFPKEHPVPDLHVKSDDLTWVYDREVKVYERAGAFPRAFVVHQAIFNPSEEPLYALLYQNRERLAEFVLIKDRPESGIQNQLAQVPVNDDSRAVMKKYSPNEVIIQATMNNPGFLVLSDLFHPDWKALVDNNPTRVYEADYLFRAVFLNPGQHTVRFVFRPFSFYLGSIISLLTVLACGFLSFTNQRRLKCYHSSGLDR